MGFQLLSLACAFLSFQGIPPAAMPQYPAAISGEVTDAASGQPVSWVRVDLHEYPGIVVSSSLGDASGRFMLQNLQPGTWRLTAKRNGFLTRSTVLALEPGQRIENLRITLTPQAVISGKVEDMDGWPVASASVQAMRYGSRNGRRRLLPVGYGETNDLGEYRIAGLSAGRYYVRAAPSYRLTEYDGRYIAGFYPGTVDERAENQIEVRAGEQVANLTIRLPKRDGLKIAGRLLLGAAKEELERMISVPKISLEIDDDSSRRTINRSLFNWRTDASFSYRDLAPGDYVLKAEVSGQTPGTLMFFARKSVRVEGADIEDIVLDLQPAAAQDIEGSISFDAHSVPDSVLIFVQPDGANTIEAASREDGSFLLHALGPGKYRINAHAMHSGISMKSARLGANELVSREFELDGRPAGPLNLTMARSVYGSLAGVVLDSGRRPVGDATIWLVATGGAPRLAGQPMSQMTDQHGRFKLNCPPGEYRLFFSEDPAPFDLLEERDFQRAHERNSLTLMVVEGTNPPLTLILSPTK